MNRTPILFLGDSPTSRTGLGRIGRDLATLVSRLPEFRVGYLGRGGQNTRQLPFTQYNFDENHQWGEMLIERSWLDFAKEEEGVVFSIWDPSRLHWFANPIGLPEELQRFLSEGRFKRWGYFPVDAQGVTGGLSVIGREVVNRYDRVLAYGMFGAKVLGLSTGVPESEVQWVPHGINMDTFTPRDPYAGRLKLGVGEEDLLIGCVMANLPRKDWGLAFETMHRLQKRRRNLKFWAHIDALEKSFAWDLRALIDDFGAKYWIKVTYGNEYSDLDLSYFYSACDLTILPSLGEGFGYPLVESLACGVPVVHGNYAGGVELVPNKEWLVEPVAWRLETLQNCRRPVYSAVGWDIAVEKVLAEKPGKDYCRDSVSHLNWPLLAPVWERWFREGLQT